MIRLSAANVSRCYFLNKKRLDTIVRFILKSVGISRAALSIAFVTDSEIKRLNYLYRKRKRPTDVLSFSMREGKHLERDRSILGDIAISVDRAKRQAKRFNSTFKKELCLYIIHGILHLVGYGDEKPSALKRMRRKEEKILNNLWRRVK